MFKVNKTDRLIFDLRMRQVDYNKQKEDSLREQIANKYGVPVKNVEINFIPITVTDEGQKLSLASDVIENIQDPKFQKQLFREYVAAYEIEDVDFDMLDSIDDRVNGFVDFDAYAAYKSYKFKYVKWDNYLSYGSGNFFDFTKLNGLVLLNGSPENQCGKTTFAIDLLRFALFGKAHKSPDLGSVFNIYRPEDTEVMVEACIEIDGHDYVIRRTVTRPALSKRTEKSKAKQKVEYFRMVNGEYEEMPENCEGESGTETNAIIRESVGSLEDYNLIISATSKTLGDLLEMGQSDKGRLFSRWLGLLSVEQKEEIAKDMWKKNVSPKLLSLSNTCNRTTIEGEIADYKTVITSDEEQKGKEEEKLNTSVENIAKLNEKKDKILSEKRSVKESLVNIDITTIENNIKYNTDILTNKRGELAQLKNEYASVKDVKFDQTDLDKANEEVERLRSLIKAKEVENAELKTLIKTERDAIARINTLIDGKRCPTCGQEISVSEQNVHIEEHNKNIGAYIERGVSNKNEITALNETLEQQRGIVVKLQEDQSRQNQKNNLELRMVAIKSNIDNIKLMIADLQRQRSEVDENKENIRLNNEINNRIRIVDEEIRAETGIKENVIRMIESLKHEITSCNKEIQKRNDILLKLTEEEKVIRIWNLYLQMVGKNGIIKMVLRRALPVINNEVARLLNGLCDFKVELSISDDNKVCMDLVRGGQRLDLGTGASGFETVMSSIALRHSLACIATLPKPNFTVLDEVLDGVAVSNYDNVRELFRRMEKSYDFIIHITHNELLSDWHDMNICVTKSDNMVSEIALR